VPARSCEFSWLGHRLTVINPAPQAY
jgi:hypothetical protein